MARTAILASCVLLGLVGFACAPREDPEVPGKNGVVRCLASLFQ